eukprot:COSAG02_NODE_57628_length_280_cov_0.569061_1_plen_55_part_10
MLASAAGESAANRCRDYRRRLSFVNLVRNAAAKIRILRTCVCTTALGAARLALCG